MKKKFKKKKIIVPKHVAIIMDGNNRWTKKNKLKLFAGHEEGIKSIEIATKTSILYGIKYLTLFSFSSENWFRPKNEVSFLMKLLRKYLRTKINNLSLITTVNSKLFSFFINLPFLLYLLNRLKHKK